MKQIDELNTHVKPCKKVQEDRKKLRMYLVVIAVVFLFVRCEDKWFFPPYGNRELCDNCNVRKMMTSAINRSDVILVWTWLKSLSVLRSDYTITLCIVFTLAYTISFSDIILSVSSVDIRNSYSYLYWMTPNVIESGDTVRLFQNELLTRYQRQFNFEPRSSLNVHNVPIGKNPWHFQWQTGW